MTIQHLTHEQLIFFYNRVREILDADCETADELLDSIQEIKNNLHRHVYSSANNPDFGKQMHRISTKFSSDEQ